MLIQGTRNSSGPLAQTSCGTRPAAIDDLYAVAKPVTETIGRPNDVHFAPAGYSLLAKTVAESIAAQLPR
jgi:lysophospholipase L1-like esterase